MLCALLSRGEVRLLVSRAAGSCQRVQLRMRRYCLLAGCLAALAAFSAAVQPAFAQSFLQRLFGFVPREQDYRSAPPDDHIYGGDGYGDSYSGNAWPEDMRTYRTMCVRLCDGYYFPVSEGVRRERLRPDANACSQRCDSDVRLYYYPTGGGSPDTMVDLSGQSYAQLPTAFLYRKKLVDGCSCKPAPWSPQEAARHQSYATLAAQQKLDAQSGARTAEASVPVSAADGTVRRNDAEVTAEEPPSSRAARRRGFSSWAFPWGRARFGWR
jgi:hypothetical protein